ncbi:MAG TPA: glycoside hydrolase family 30 beta sandwich domain-containing protein [Terriglobales bacterium]|jgi:glucosylceramidase|nr:glycoside hydrolase family 30 beta sandwich domain-containing protein [Terriglobales bacterium]
MQSNRRTFLTTCSAVVAYLASRRSSLLWGSAASGVRGWVTSKNRRSEQMEAPQWRDARAGSFTGIRIDPGQRYQEILGFGAAFTDASCYLFQRMNSGAREALLAELFGPTGLRLSVGRTCIGASDYSTSAYSFDDSSEPDPELTRFSIEHDRAYILPSLRSARQANPDLFLFSSPWSPPGWMKSGGSMLGGSMRKKYFAPYAEYFVKFLQGYSAEGVKINAITVQNEVDTDQDGRMPAALWGQEYEIEFVKRHLGPALERASLDTKIWILDHNYNLWGRAIDELSDPGVNQRVDGIAWHGYGGTPDAMTRVHDAFPTKHNYWTEGGPDISSPDYATDWVKWSHNFAGILRNWAQCIVGWNLLLDEKGMPNIGPFPCGGVVTIDSKTGSITRSGQYWAFAHYSKMIERGARVIASHGELDGIDHVAVENPNGSHVLVVTNRGEQQRLECRLGERALDLMVEPDSITTLAW